VTQATEQRLRRAYLIRAVEERLLKLFSEGRLTGTTHTCIGQEMAAIALADALDPQRDLIFSNHRCHGHYLAWTDDVEGLLAEVMGKGSGVCGGIGGSQHLCGRRFFSNGIQGGIVPVAAGLAFAQKLVGSRAIVAVCIGDGTLGEGAVYETLNIAARWELPLLVVLENNSYAQSTSQAETLAGEICARPAAFGIPTFRGDTWRHAQLMQTLRDAADQVRRACAPAFVQVDTYRLAAHSKGDDNRDPAEIAEYSSRDPVNVFLAQRAGTEDADMDAVRRRVERAVESAVRAAPLEMADDAAEQGTQVERRAAEPYAGTQLDAINSALRAWMSADHRVILLGEDIRSPYGGAFKVTRGLSDACPDRVINTPISEAGIVGIGNGLALGGWRPVVEIMFGDFLTLTFDQLLNHAAKFRGMYNQRVSNPLVVRTPMGGGRGYGPTHSQNLEKHFVGIPGLTVLVLHGRTPVAAVYEALARASTPILVLENKLLYRERCDAPLPDGYQLVESGSSFPTSVLRPAAAPDITVVAFGRMSVLVERAARTLAAQEEIRVEVVLPTRVWPLDLAPIAASTARTGRLLVVEEGTAGFDLASEVIASLLLEHRASAPRHVRKLAAAPTPIPSAVDLERAVLPQEADIVEACLGLFDA
jgi:2-oxoisovalerate dehydrogenase E1 component